MISSRKAVALYLKMQIERTHILHMVKKKKIIYLWLKMIFLFTISARGCMFDIQEVVNEELYIFEIK